MNNDDNNNNMLQDVMEAIFYKNPDYPKNTIIPAATRLNETEILLSGLILAANDTYTFFQNHEEFKTELSLHLEEDQSTKDLVLRVTFRAGEEQVTLDAVVDGKNVKRQAKFVDELKRGDHILFFISDRNFKLMKVLEIGFQPKQYMEVLSQL